MIAGVNQVSINPGSHSMDELFTTCHRPLLDTHQSPAEAELGFQLLKVMADDGHFQQQVSVDTPNGTFVIDCVVEAGGRGVGFEVDAPGHGNRRRADWRDAAILATDVVDAIVHIPQFDVLWYPRDALHLISRVEPSMFSPRGRIILERVAQPEVRRAVVTPRDERLSAVIWRKEAGPESGDERRQGKAPTGDEMDEMENVQQREATPELERILSDHRRRNLRSSHRLDIVRHRNDGRLKPLITRARR